MKVARSCIAFVLAFAAFGLGFAGDEKKLYFLEFDHKAPKELYLRSGPGDTEPEVFWYVLYTIRNRDKEDHAFFLEVTAETDRGEVYRDGYHPLALERVREMTGNKAAVHLQDGTTIEGRVEWNADRIDIDMGTESRSVLAKDVEKIQYKLWGHREVTMPEEAGPRVSQERRPLGKPFRIARPVIRGGETIECVAIFPRINPDMDRLTIKVMGLTNDVIVEHVEAHTRKVTEKVFEIVYERPGDEFYPSLDKISFVKKGWVDRERIIKTDLRSPREAK